MKLFIFEMAVGELEPRSFRLRVQCSDHLATPPHTIIYVDIDLPSVGLSFFVASCMRAVPISMATLLLTYRKQNHLVLYTPK